MNPMKSKISKVFAINLSGILVYFISLLNLLFFNPFLYLRKRREINLIECLKK